MSLVTSWYGKRSGRKALPGKNKIRSKDQIPLDSRAPHFERADKPVIDHNKHIQTVKLAEAHAELYCLRDREMERERLRERGRG